MRVLRYSTGDMKRAKAKRLDVLLVDRGFAESRSQAQGMIRAGWVKARDRVLDKPGTRVLPDCPIELKQRPRYVSRGGGKMEAALDRFGVCAEGWVVADVGASTGGFTDCLLQRGAAKVYAIDVGYGQLSWRLRNDARVEVMERTNARYLETLPEKVDLVSADVSFISLDLILPAGARWLKERGQVIALIKPQFEAGRSDVGRGGVVRDTDVHRRVLERVLTSAGNAGLALRGLMVSPLRGPAGNVEFLGWWRYGGESIAATEAIDASLAESYDVAGA